MTDPILTALAHGFVMPDLHPVATGGGNPAGADAPSASAAFFDPAGTGGAPDGLGGALDKPTDGGAAPTANGAAQPLLWCSECEDEPVWCEESDIGFSCVERRLLAWGGGA